MGNTLSKFAKGETGQAASNAQPADRGTRQPAELRTDAVLRSAGQLLAQPHAAGLPRAPVRHTTASITVSGVALGATTGTRTVADPPMASALPHWGRLAPGPAREYTGQVYDTSIVKRVFPHEIYSWEHHKTAPALMDLASLDAWEDHAVPPIRLAYSEAGVNAGGRKLHYAITDGHHRLNAAKRASVGIPAMVTHRWEPDANGQHIDHRGSPHIAGTLPVPCIWNRFDKPVVIHVPEKVEQTKVWGTQQLTVSLAGARHNLSLAEIADKLNAFKRPDAFLDRAAGDLVRVRVTLQDVYGRADDNSKLGDMKADLQFADVNHAAKDWKAILKDTRPLEALFPPRSASQYPILLVQVQQNRYSFITDEM